MDDKIVDVDCFRCRDDSVVDSGGGVLLIAACTAEGNVSVFRRREGDSKEGDEEEKNVIENKVSENEGEQREEGGGRRQLRTQWYSSCKFDPNGDGRVVAMVTSGGASASFTTTRTRNGLVRLLLQEAMTMVSLAAIVRR